MPVKPFGFVLGVPSWSVQITGGLHSTRPNPAPATSNARTRMGVIAAKRTARRALPFIDETLECCSQQYVHRKWASRPGLWRDDFQVMTSLKVPEKTAGKQVGRFLTTIRRTRFTWKAIAHRR